MEVWPPQSSSFSSSYSSSFTPPRFVNEDEDEEENEDDSCPATPPNLRLTLPRLTGLLRRSSAPHSMKPFSARLLALLAAVFATGCASRDPRFSNETIYMGGFRTQPDAGRANFDNVSYWDGDGVAGSPRIRIKLGEQRAYFYKGGELVGISTLSSGREGYDTPTGTYKIQQKDIDHVSSAYGNYVDTSGNILMKEIDTRKDKRPPGAIYDGARMPYFMRITGGVGMHEGFLPGYAASHGCIRMPGFMAHAFFRNVEVGTPVTVEH